MGAPKLKWTSGEEAALKAGVAKYGMGKWSTILKDPDFALILRSRSNVDLKDKWRNLHVMTNGWGSRQRGKIVGKITQSKNDDDDDEPMALTTVVENDVDILDAKPLATVNGSQTEICSKKPITSLDNLIMEAIAKLKEPRGSSRNAICMFIEESYQAPPNLERLLAANLKVLTEKRRLVKVKHFYRIAPSGMSMVDVKMEPSPLLLEGKQMTHLAPRPESSNGTRMLTKAQIDVELERMRNMNAHEAAIAAAQAVAEAEAAIAEAERAAMEAEEAEAEAEAARCFAEAATKALNFQTTIHV
ncbi:unnamed protein product [Cuscuta europaea]|uniref:MYB transcription factor n=1 Tax=Cuscuta europaea TaxID=41803 RepID=A0A9P1EGR0_CUSEU|nr:unnamed protein product [Cuscuta europaea]